MSLAELPMIFILLGLVFYIVLAGADFGAAIWQVTARPTERGERIREHAHEAMAPVWEANHVWLIFVLTVAWTAYPAALGSLASTLSVALVLAGLGIITRGAAYATRSGATEPKEMRRIDAASAISSILTPFALGAAIGGVASARVPYGNAAGDLVTSWLNPTSVVIGALSVAFSAYLAAVYLCADATRRGESDLVEPFRRRALGAGAVTGVLALVGLLVLEQDAHRLFRELVTGGGLPALLISGAGGAGTLGLVVRRRFEPARYTAGLAVAAIVAGWALAQQPQLLPGLTVRAAAAPHDVLVAITIAIVGGGIILFPSLVLLFRLALGGRLGQAEAERASEAPRSGELLFASAPGFLGRTAIASLALGTGLLAIAEADWAHAVGLIALLAFVVVGFLWAVPALLE
ncbi:MAG: cytochrome d ubiquinol oxidase subunit II [Actinomycetota bacterium]|nr:cytochrome d ubiquinol oxidase subunit II [Actinomycetota bacterium]